MTASIIVMKAEDTVEEEEEEEMLYEFCARCGHPHQNLRDRVYKTCFSCDMDDLFKLVPGKCIVCGDDCIDRTASVCAECQSNTAECQSNRQ